MAKMCNEICPEAARLERMETNIEWLKKNEEKKVETLKDIGAYKKLTWFNFIIVAGVALKNYFIPGA